MIPAAYVQAWRVRAPWSTSAQVEQDLVISRALVSAYSDPVVASRLAFRGGTALHKLHFERALRYSEDIDLVQVEAEPIGSTLAALRGRLDPWLGEPNWKQSEGRFTLVYRFAASGVPPTPMRLKVEINTREHFAVLGFQRRPLSVRSPWFSGEAELLSYSLEELLGTKLRALYQRRKGRDLFDLAAALQHHPGLDLDAVVRCFEAYVGHGGSRVTRAEFEANLNGKLRLPAFRQEVRTLLPSGAGSSDYEAADAYDQVHAKLIVRLPGDGWNGAKSPQ